MVMRRLLILTTLVASLAACSPPPSNYPYEKEPDPRRSEYVIGVADRLSIRVWKNPELNTDIEVRPDGTITMPLLGDVRAVDITPTELKKEIGKALSQYIKEAGAVVTVAVTEVNAYKVTVSGNVLQPGVYSSRQFLTVADAVALAGGPNRFAKVNEVVLIRPNPKGGVRRIPVDYEAIQKGEQLRQNLVLVRGDTLFFP
ncbi:MAG: polysaccharide transporter [Deltaproteobacteria bacterium HGW-Deltaproteobacteria-20]|jgi:polysaccharide export outer membrane protein|nr:MAG: polysaccharide transporter [Deltaproteobacteria bacterium HGW-Deltaproteobacteria-20]